MCKRDFIGDYKWFLNNVGFHETEIVKYVKQRALDCGYEVYNSRKKYLCGDKIIFEFRDRLVGLVELGKDLSEGSNLIVSHMDSPRLSVIPGNPIVEEEDGVFVKTVPYGGIINQLYLDKPLMMVGRVYNDNNELVEINTGKDGYLFNVSSLLPHLNGRKEIKELTYEKLRVRIGNDSEDNIFEIIKEKYNITKENLKLAELSFVPYGDVIDIGFDKDLMMSRNHDDLCCTFASLEAFLNSEKNNITKIFLGVSYEEIGSNKSTGAISQFIDDIFLMLADGNILLARECMRNTKVVSADVCASFDSNYSSHFENGAKAIAGNGVTLVPIVGNKRGNDTSIQMKNYIERLCKDNDIKYQVEFTAPKEGGGGTVSSFFAVRSMECIDIAIPTLSMHSPFEMISKKDIFESYKLYKVFYESN